MHWSYFFLALTHRHVSVVYVRANVEIWLMTRLNFIELHAQGPKQSVVESISSDNGDGWLDDVAMLASCGTDLLASVTEARMEGDSIA